ncbi:MAG: hypothetical protein U0Y82_03365 [Thermoleophilia bacterium]
MSAGRANAKKKSGGRRANYAPAADQVGYRKYLPTGWANWLGFGLFLFVGGAMLVAGVTYVADTKWADAVAALVMGGALMYMTYLFGTTRLRD